MGGLKTTITKYSSSPSFKIGTNLKINLDGEKDKPDVKPKGERITSSLIKNANKMLKPNMKFDRESNQDVKEPNTNKITYEEEKVALILGTTAVFTVWWMFK